MGVWVVSTVGLLGVVLPCACMRVYLFICFELFGVLECSFLHPPTPDLDSYQWGRGVREGSQRKWLLNGLGPCPIPYPPGSGLCPVPMHGAWHLVTILAHTPHLPVLAAGPLIMHLGSFPPTLEGAGNYYPNFTDEEHENR